MNPDGTVNIRRLGMKTNWWRDLYHFLLKTDWTQALLLIASGYLVLNLAFAVLFWWPGGTVSGVDDLTFVDAFFFSVQTFSTIGYGGMSPVGMYANLLVTVEALVGLLFSAMATGFLFAKFATPTSRVRFSRTAIFGRHDGEPMFMFRMANERSNQIVEATMTLVIIRNEVTREGERFRRFYDMKLRRSRSPIFSLGWTAFHPVDEDSPLFGATPQSLEEQEAIVLVTFSGTDSTFAQTVHARHAYTWHEIEFDRRFVDLIRVEPNGERLIDYTHFHRTEPAEPVPQAVHTLVG